MLCDISFIGFGEAARAFVGAPGWQTTAAAFDVKEHAPAERADLHQAYSKHDVRFYTTARDLAQNAGALISTVTADQALIAAGSVIEHIATDTLYLDMNSVSPSTKQRAGSLLSAAGGAYVDVAVMAPVYPKQLDVPLLLSGKAAEGAEALLRSAGFTDIKVVGDQIGRASTIKMVRSVMVKGIEALTMECMLAAHRADIVDEVLASLGSDWRDRANYNLERMLTHGARRAAEMEQVCNTLADLDIDPVMSRSTVARQSEMAALALGPVPEALEEKLQEMNAIWEVAAE